MTVNKRSAILKGPFGCPARQRHADALAPMLTPDSEARHTPRADGIIEETCQRPVLDNARQSSSRNYARPSRHLVIDEGQQANRWIGSFDLTTERSRIVDSLVTTETLTPA